jgi:hypothetical protein
VARSAGIGFFRAYVLQENEPMRELLEGLGAYTELDSPGVVRFDVPLDPDSIPDSPVGRVLKAVALHIVAPVARPFPM